MTSLRRRYLFYAAPTRNGAYPEEAAVLAHDQRVCVVTGPAFRDATERCRVRFEDGFECEVANAEIIECGGMASW